MQACAGIISIGLPVFNPRTGTFTLFPELRPKPANKIVRVRAEPLHLMAAALKDEENVSMLCCVCTFIDESQWRVYLHNPDAWFPYSNHLKGTNKRSFGGNCLHQVPLIRRSWNFLRFHRHPVVCPPWSC